MSRHRIFAFVEGKVVDPSFYDKLVRSALRKTGHTHEVLPITAITGNGGKPEQVKFYTYLRRSRRLNQKNNGGTVSAVFFVDRDFDEQRQIMIRSKNVIYTTHYNVEAEVFANADGVEALARATGMTEADSVAFHSSQSGWVDRLATLWRDWIELCLLSVAADSQCGIKPARQSTIQTTTFGPVDPHKAISARQFVKRTALHPDAEQFERLAAAECSKIEAKHGSLRPLLSGKHLGQYLEWLVSSAPCAERCKTQGLGSTAALFYLSALDFELPWSEPFKQPLRKLLAST